MSPPDVVCRAPLAFTLLAAAYTGAVVAPVSADETQPEASLEELSGTYRNATNGRNERTRNAAIDKVVDEMNFLVRGIARGRLKDANPVDRRITIRQRGDRLTTSFDGRSYSARLGGPGRVVEGITGDELRLTFRVHEDRLVQRFDGGDKGRQNVFELDDEGHLRLSVTVWADRLPSNVRYELRYEPVD